MRIAFTLLGVAGVLGSGCALIAAEGNVSGPIRSAALRIPSWELPPPGQCRVWYPERAAVNQPPAGKCEDLQPIVPPGAWLIHVPENRENEVEVHRFHPDRPGVKVAIRTYDAESGKFLSEDTLQDADVQAFAP